MTMQRNTKRENPEGESTIHVEDDGISGDDEEDVSNITIDDANQTTAVIKSPHFLYLRTIEK